MHVLITYLELRYVVAPSNFKRVMDRDHVGYKGYHGAVVATKLDRDVCRPYGVTALD